jgi:hypothetical protein
MNSSPFIASILGVRDARGIAQKSGYMFALYLRGPDGRWQREPVPADGAAAPAIAANATGHETEWICYAWPTARTQSGTRAFVVNQSGDVCQTANTAPSQCYTGTTCVPAPTAALAPDGRTIAIAAKGIPAADGGQWAPAGS